MALLKRIQNRQIQKKANSFIKSLNKKSEKQIEQAYLDNKEFENNEIVLSYLFFKHPNLIRILPVNFQKSRINSNLTMFKYGSNDAKKEIVLSWLKDNKFFMNANVVQFTEEEYSDYIKLYFQQPEDISKLFMDDLKDVVSTLSKADIKKTENIIEKIKDNFTDRQWEFIIEANPSFIKYANQNVQNKYSQDEKYFTYINGEARKKFIDNQIEKIKENELLLNTMPLDVQSEYINKYPYMINSLDNKSLIELLKYDIKLIKYVNLPMLQNEKDDNQEVLYGLLENIESKSIKEIINIFINIGLVNAKGKLFRFDKNSNNVSYQYTKSLISVIQKLDINQIISLIMIDVNYVLPYIAPLYLPNDSIKDKEKIVIDCNSRCLKLFKAYYNEETYEKYYKVINKIFNDYLANIEKYNYETDYNCIFDIFKVLFNKNIITKNDYKKIIVFVGMSLLYKENAKPGVKEVTIKLLNEILSIAYEKTIINNKELYDLSTLEIFDSRLSFIPHDLLYDYIKYNFINISSLLFLAKANKVSKYFKKYYDIVSKVCGENKESLFKSVENFQYYIDILRNTENIELSEEEEENFIELLVSNGNNCNINKKEQLEKYDIVLLKKLVSELSAIKDEKVYKNLLCNYLFNRGYDQNGNFGLLETDTIKEICGIFSSDVLENLEVNDKKVFDKEEASLFSMINLMFKTKDIDILFLFIENILNRKVKRNIVSIIQLFNKIKEYRVELINSQIVSLEEIELLYLQKPEIVTKEEKNKVTIYTVINQDFKILSSVTNEETIYSCCNVSKIKKNSYGYDYLEKEGSIRFASFDEDTIIKINKDKKEKSKMQPTFIFSTNEINDNLIDIAKDNDLAIVCVKENKGEL